MKRVIGCVAVVAWGCASDVQPLRVDLDAKGRVFPASFVDVEGQTWSVRKITSFVDKMKEPTGPNTAPPGEVDGLSDKDFAERFRPVSFNPDTGLEQTLTSPMDVAKFAALRAKDRAEVRMRTFRDESGVHTIEFGDANDHSGEGELRPATAGSPGSGVRPQSVIGSDTRSWVGNGNNFVAPFGAQVSLTGTPYGSGGNCSATLIGWSTAITAAHCVHDGTNWLSTRTWAVGVINNGIATYAWAPTTGCYWVTIPNAFIGSNQNIAYDYAVLDFKDPRTCVLEPGRSTGFFNIAIGSATNYSSASMQLAAYDASGSPAPLPPPVGHPRPSLLWRFGTGYQDLPYFPHQLLHSLDTSGGASGGGMLATLFSNVGDYTWYWIGSNTREYGWINGSRRLDYPLFGFIQANSVEY